MAGALMTMPMLVINMGAEMVYVLDQRLKAQNIPREKSSKVLEDIIKTMHNEKFMAELFRPHRMYSNVSTRQIFDRLAHSSIMRLNTNSMDKLYDLMRMGFKYQLLSCSSADELLQVTVNHLRNTRQLIEAEEVKRMIDDTTVMCTQAFGSMSPANFYQLRQYLCRFFQDTRIKVSLFLQNGIQGADGTLSLRHDGFTATGGRVPGSVRYFDEHGRVDEEERFAIASSTDAVGAPDVPVLEREQLNAHLGFNMYEADAKSPGGGSGAFSRSTKQLLADAKQAKRASPKKLFKATAEDGLNLLANLLGNADPESKPLRINLFPSAARRHRQSKEGETGGGGDEFEDDEEEDDDGEEVPTIWIDAASDRKHPADRILSDLKLADDDSDSKRDDKGAGDDLLDLMDSAAN